MQYCELTLTVPPEALEAVGHLLADAGGFEIVDERRACLRAWLPRDQRLARRLAGLRRRLMGLQVHFAGLAELGWQERTVAEEDWAHAWRAHFRAQRVGRRLVVAPTWAPTRTWPGEVAVRLDPGMAFGTGTHASTWLCLQAVERLAPGGGTALDAGSGSGILAVAAALLGAARVTALDVDPVAVRVARENAARNAVADRVEVRCADVGQEPAPDEAPADWAVANLTAELLEEVAGGLARRVRPGGTLVASGFTVPACPRVARRLATAGLFPLRRVDAEGWTALWTRRA